MSAPAVLTDPPASALGEVFLKWIAGGLSVGMAVHCVFVARALSDYIAASDRAGDRNAEAAGAALVLTGDRAL